MDPMEILAARVRVANYLRARSKMGGLDQEVLHGANDVELLASDLRTLVAALGGPDDIGGV